MDLIVLPYISLVYSLEPFKCIMTRHSLFQNLLPIYAFIRVVLFFFMFVLKILLKSQVKKKLVPETGPWISLLLKLPLAWIFLLHKVPIAWISLCSKYYIMSMSSKYHSSSFLVALTPLAWVIF